MWVWENKIYNIQVLYSKWYIATYNVYHKSMIYFYFTCLMSIILNNPAMKCIPMFFLSLSLSFSLYVSCFSIFHFLHTNSSNKKRNPFFKININKNEWNNSEELSRKISFMLEYCNIYGIVKEAVEISGSYYLLSFIFLLWKFKII